ncbi:DUF3533 domain-containing protein [Gorillibacterium massiliense]|uniref:YhgE/Pip domain-containing protein n=1 Tax=Gorillibacterium massiliense TaxID=1280390 RepID=UPI0004B3531C|nr:DUF3533 domain-containing protein [Gorillibacterium massiliense]
MKRFFKQKQPYIALVAVFAVILLLGLAQLGSSVNPVPKNLPVLLVQTDEGVKLPNGTEMNYGKLIEDKMTLKETATGGVSPLIWTKAANEQEARDAMNREKAYAAVIIPEDFSAKLASLMIPTGAPASARIIVNQGMNNSGATMTSQILTQMFTAVNGQIREQMLDQLGKAGATLTAEQTKAIATPVLLTTENINAIGTSSANGNAPVALTQIVWFAAMVTTLLLHFATKNTALDGSLGHRFGIRLAQLLTGAVITAVAAASVLLIIGKWVGLSIPDYNEIGLYLFLICFSFFLIQSAIVSWLGMAGVPLFVLVFFFGAPILSLPPQILPQFSHDWLYSWVPFRFSAEILRDLFYFRQGLNLDQPLAILATIGAVSLVVFLLSALKKRPAAEHEARPAAELAGEF